jgi:hypothetical protein
VAPKLRAMAAVWKDLIPACGDLKNPALQERHWEKLEGIVGFRFERDPDTWEEPFTLGSLLNKNIMQYREEIQKVSTEATQEGVLEEMLGKVKSSWVNAEFQLSNFKDSKDVFILSGIDEIQALLDDSMVTMGTILASRFVAGIRPEVEKMEGSLRSLQSVLDEWLNVQKNWMYLEPIFSAPDIQRQVHDHIYTITSVYACIVEKNWIKSRCSQSLVHHTFSTRHAPHARTNTIYIYIYIYICIAPMQNVCAQDTGPCRIDVYVCVWYTLELMFMVAAASCVYAHMCICAVYSQSFLYLQLPAEAKMFLDIDKGLKNIMKKVSENPNCMRIGTQPGQAEQFSGWNDILEKIQKQLEDYLEFKRMAFPRFYFLSNDELLEILAQTRNVQAVQPHMMKCFDAIKVCICLCVCVYIYIYIYIYI